MSPTMNAPVPIPETPLTQAAANRIAKVFRGNPEEIAAWLDLIHLNATTTMAMMFQDPSIPDSRQAAAESSQALIENARQLSSAAKLLPEQAEQFVGAHQRAIDEFNRALELAMRRGAGDRRTLAMRVMHVLHLPVGPLENVDEETWFDRLDEMDEAARRRRQRNPGSPIPNGKNRDEIAHWIARTHFTADSSISQIWYLPEIAPPDEIRFLEVSDRILPGGNTVEPIDFGLDIEGVSCRLSVADITTDQLQRIKEGGLSLPTGWSIAGAARWGRRG